MLGIRDTIPFKHTKFEIRGLRDNLTEWITVEVPTHNGKKVRITNVYVPPVRKIRRTNVEGSRTSNPTLLTGEELEEDGSERPEIPTPVSDNRTDQDGGMTTPVRYSTLGDGHPRTTIS